MEQECKNQETGKFLSEEECKLRMKRRIVKGYPPGPRPWMAFIQIKKSEDDPLLGRCAGSIINREWILSAAHCFCDMTPCKQKRKFKSVDIYFLYLITNSNLKGGKGPISIAFEPKDHILIVLGLNDFRLSAFEANDDKNYHPKEIILHPK